MDRIRLTDVADRPVRTYSGGMRRRIDLAASLVGRPDVLFLDEPTTGVDPASRQDIWRLVRDLAADGATVLLTTQFLGGSPSSITAAWSRRAPPPAPSWNWR